MSDPNTNIEEESKMEVELPPKTDEDVQPEIKGEVDFDYPAIPHEKVCADPSQFIWSEEKATFPESFLDSESKYEKQAPPPKYLTEEELLKRKYTEQKDILSGFKKMKDGVLVCTDEETIANQSGILTDVLRQLTVNLLKGLTITHISMPVKIFEARTSLERMCDLFSFAPVFLKRAAESQDRFERLKLGMAYAMSAIYLICGQNKPFNPLLGETMQIKLDDETTVYGEHISHHPPISAYLIEGPGYKVHGYVEFIGSMGANHLRAGQKGPHYIEFDDGHRIRFALMDYKLGGTIRGARTVEPLGNFVFEDLSENLRAIVIVNTYRKSGYWTVTETGKKDEFKGVIYKPTEDIDEKACLKKYFKKNPQEVQELTEIKDIKEEIAKVSGSVLQSIEIDGEELWNINKHIPVRHYPVTDSFVCPSDWRFREDLIWLKRKCLEYAGAWKLKKENQQRRDRANRAEATKQRNKGQ